MKEQAKTPLIYNGIVSYDRILSKWCGEFSNVEALPVYHEDLYIVYCHMQNTIICLIDDGILPDDPYEIKLVIPIVDMEILWNIKKRNK